MEGRLPSALKLTTQSIKIKNYLNMEWNLELFAHQKKKSDIERNNIYEQLLIKILSGGTRHDIY